MGETVNKRKVLVEAMGILFTIADTPGLDPMATEEAEEIGLLLEAFLLNRGNILEVTPAPTAGESWVRPA